MGGYSENLIPIMTSNTTPKGRITASHPSRNGYRFWWGFDGKLDLNSDYSYGSFKSTFVVNAKNNVWLCYEFDAPTKVNKFSFINNHDTSSPKNFRFEGSNDLAVWDVLFSIKNSPALVGKWREFIFNNNKNYNAYRIFIESNHGFETTNINEIQMYQNIYPPNKYIIEDGDAFKKSTMEGLQVVEGILDAQLFEEHGTDYLPDIIGQYDREVDMIYKEDLGDKKIYGYEFVGYTDLSISSESKGLMKSDSGQYYSYIDGELIKIDNPVSQDDFVNEPTNLEDLTKMTDKRVFTMENGEIEGSGKTFSKKISPQDWNRKILRMKEM